MIYSLACHSDNILKLKDLAGVPYCSGGWTLVQVPEQFSLEQLDPAVLGQMFGVGFTLVSTILVFSIGVRAVLNFLKN